MPKKIKGFTLIELMVGITISMILVIAITASYMGARQSNRITSSAQQLQEQGRSVLNYLGRYIEMAGYTPFVDGSAVGTLNPWDATIPASGPGLINGFGDAIRGCDGGFQAALSNNFACRSDATRPDSLTIAYRTNDPIVSEVSGEKLDCLRQKIEITPSTNTMRVQNRFFLIQRVYTENGVPVTASELSCEGNGNLGVSQPVFSGVQDLQILYGVAAAGSQVPQQYFPASLVTDWNQVIALKVCVLMRTIDSSITGDARTYQDCQGNTVTPPATDTYLYRSFNGVYVLRNRVTDFLAGG